MSPDPRHVADLVEIHQICARYMGFAAEFVLDRWLEVFTPDAEYSAFIAEMKRQKVKILLVEPYFDLKTPNSIARETSAKVLVLAPSVGAEPPITDYLKLFDYAVNLVVSGIKETRSK